MEDKTVDNFLKELFDLYEKYNISISHEDQHGGFIFEEDCKVNREWIKAARDDRDN